MTAGEVATKTGLARATVSTTLSKLAKTGEVEKAERGYRLPSAPAATPSRRTRSAPARVPFTPRGGATVARCSRSGSDSTSTP